MTKDIKKIPVTQTTYELMIEKKILLQNLVALENGEKALENDFRMESLKNQNSEFRQNIVINQRALDDHLLLLDRVKVVTPAQQNEVVKVGSIVVLKFPDQVVTMTFDGMSFTKGVISVESPLGQKMYGKKVGDTFEVNQKIVTIQEIQLPKI